MNKQQALRQERLTGQIIRLERFENVLNYSYDRNFDRLLKHYRPLRNEIRQKIDELLSQRQRQKVLP